MGVMMKLTKFSGVAIAALAAMAAVSAATPAAASRPINILRYGQSDGFVVYNGNGAIAATAYAYESNEVANGFYQLPDYVTTDAGKVPMFDQSQFGHYTAWTEPNDPNNAISDVFGVYQTVTGGPGGPVTVYHLGFKSDDDAGNLPNLDGFQNSDVRGTTLVEPVGAQDATKYLSPDLQRLGYTALFQSDFASVPEPASWMMMIVGVGLMGAGMRTRARKAASFA